MRLTRRAYHSKRSMGIIVIITFCFIWFGSTIAAATFTFHSRMKIFHTYLLGVWELSHIRIYLSGFILRILTFSSFSLLIKQRPPRNTLQVLHIKSEKLI